jgi:membrane-bound lytic murein transglycosylase B
VTFTAAIAGLLTGAVLLTARTQAPATPAAPGASPQQPGAPANPANAAEAATPSGTVDRDVRPSFAEWLDGIRTEALARGIREDIVQLALDGIEEPLPVVIERDRAQAELVLPLETYISRQLSQARIRTARSRFSEHRDLLDRVAAAYDVPARVIVAIWGIESNFGQFTGVRPTVAALATLAWDPRRSSLFRRELFNALEILNRGDVTLAELRGSWAGAMGQPQFMPSSYLRYAEDFDGDGRRDIWSTAADVFASVANYLKGYGWTPGERWGREVRVSPQSAGRIAAGVDRRGGSCSARRDMTVPLPLEEWQRLGVRPVEGDRLPSADITASLVSGATRHFLVYRNYDVLLEYNCAHAYALTVSLLADAIGG